MIGYKHSTQWGFGDIVWHRLTADRGMVVGIQLRPESQPNYLVVFEDRREETLCSEFELTAEKPVQV